MDVFPTLNGFALHAQSKRKVEAYFLFYHLECVCGGAQVCFSDKDVHIYSLKTYKKWELPNIYFFRISKTSCLVLISIARWPPKKNVLKENITLKYQTTYI